MPSSVGACELAESCDIHCNQCITGSAGGKLPLSNHRHGSAIAEWACCQSQPLTGERQVSLTAIFLAYLS